MIRCRTVWCSRIKTVWRRKKKHPPCLHSWIMDLFKHVLSLHFRSQDNCDKNGRSRRNWSYLKSRTAWGALSLRQLTTNIQRYGTIHRHQTDKKSTDRQTGKTKTDRPKTDRQTLNCLVLYGTFFDRTWYAYIRFRPQSFFSCLGIRMPEADGIDLTRGVEKLGGFHYFDIIPDTVLYIYLCIT